MEFTRLRGRTCYLTDWLLIPLYMTDESHCVLLDAGDVPMREELEETLLSRGITPCGIICTHVHPDHSGNNAYFRKKYGIPVLAQEREAALAVSALNIKAYFSSVSQGMVSGEPRLNEMVCPADVVVRDERRVSFCGAEFGLVPTPGHSPGHIAVKTPDGVLYVGDAMMAGEDLENAKLPFNFSYADAFRSLELLKKQKAEVCIAAHKGVFTDLPRAADACRASYTAALDTVVGCVEGEMSPDRIYEAVCRHFRLLTSNMYKAEIYERNIRTFVEYAFDTGRLGARVEGGVCRYYRK